MTGQPAWIALETPGESADWLRELHIRHTLVYGTPASDHSLLRLDPEKQEAEIVFLKRKTRARSYPHHPRYEDLTFEIDGDLTPLHWERIREKPPEGDPKVVFPYEYDRDGIYFGYATLVLPGNGVEVELSHPYPLIEFLKDSLMQWANDRIVRMMGPDY